MVKSKRNSPEPKVLQGVQTLEQPTLALQIVNRYFLWIILLVALSCVFIAYTFFIDTQIREVRDVAQQSLDAKEQTLSALKDIKRDLDLVVTDFGLIMERKSEDIARLDALLPHASEYGDLYTIVNEVVTLSGLKLTNITIAFEDGGEANLVTGAPPAVARPVPQVKTMTLHISVEGGTYQTFKAFLERLERSIRLFDVQSLSLDGAAFIPLEDGVLPTPHYDIELKTYYQS